ATPKGVSSSAAVEVVASCTPAPPSSRLDSASSGAIESPQANSPTTNKSQCLFFTISPLTDSVHTLATLAHATASTWLPFTLFECAVEAGFAPHGLHDAIANAHVGNPLTLDPCAIRILAIGTVLTIIVEPIAAI